MLTVRNFLLAERSRKPGLGGIHGRKGVGGVLETWVIDVDFLGGEGPVVLGGFPQCKIGLESPGA